MEEERDVIRKEDGEGAVTEKSEGKVAKGS